MKDSEKDNEFRDDLEEALMKEGLIKENKDYTASYPIPDNSSQSFVILSLAIGQSKFHEPALNTLGRLPEKEEDSMIEAGLKVLDGKMTAEAYTTKLFGVFKKLYKDNLVVLGKDKGQEEGMRSQIELRVQGNSSTPQNANQRKQMLKEADVLDENRDTDMYKQVMSYLDQHPDMTFQQATDEVMKNTGFALEETFDAKNADRTEIYDQIKSYIGQNPGTDFKTAMRSVLSGLGVTELLEEGIDETVLAQMGKDFQNLRIDGQRPDSVSTEGGYAAAEFRHVGNWIHDEEGHDYEDDEDHDAWKEDDDNEILAPGEGRRLLEQFVKWASQYPWFSKVALDINPSEKNWCEFSACFKENVIREGEYDAMARPFLNSGLHPVAQNSVASGFSHMVKVFPGITDTDCRKEDGKIKCFFTYKGKNYSFGLNLNGDTATAVERGIKQRIAPKPTTGHLIRMR